MEEEIPSSDEKKIPTFLYFTYAILILGGIVAFFAFWNGSAGWSDRGYSQKLQQAASTTYPYEKKDLNP